MQLQHPASKKRQYCIRCDRPLATCVCQYALNIANQSHIVVLQHPTEVKQSKGSAKLLSLSCHHLHTLVGEDFSDNSQLNALLTETRFLPILLFPNEQAKPLLELKCNGDTEQRIPLLIILDGTWRKAYKMWRLSSNLQQLPCYQLPSDIKGRYLIRKAPNQQALSTFEATLYALSILESKPIPLMEALNRFDQFNQFQLSFRPK